MCATQSCKGQRLIRTFREGLSLPNEILCVPYSQGASRYVHYARIAFASMDLLNGVDG